MWVSHVCPCWVLSLPDSPFLHSWLARRAQAVLRPLALAAPDAGGHALAGALLHLQQQEGGGQHRFTTGRMHIRYFPEHSQPPARPSTLAVACTPPAATPLRRRYLLALGPLNQRAQPRPGLCVRRLQVLRHRLEVLFLQLLLCCRPPLLDGEVAGAGQGRERGRREGLRRMSAWGVACCWCWC